MGARNDSLLSTSTWGIDFMVSQVSSTVEIPQNKWIINKRKTCCCLSLGFCSLHLLLFFQNQCCHHDKYPLDSVPITNLDAQFSFCNKIFSRMGVWSWDTHQKSWEGECDRNLCHCWKMSEQWHWVGCDIDWNRFTQGDKLGISLIFFIRSWIEKKKLSSKKGGTR